MTNAANAAILTVEAKGEDMKQPTAIAAASIAVALAVAAFALGYGVGDDNAGTKTASARPPLTHWRSASITCTGSCVSRQRRSRFGPVSRK